MENQEILKNIQTLLDKFNSASQEQEACFKKTKDAENEINHAVWSALKPEKVSFLDNSIGHKIIYSFKDELYLFQVNHIHYGKWEIRLNGHGVKYDLLAGDIRETSYLILEYDSYMPGKETVSLADDASLNDITNLIESNRKTALKTSQENINKRYDAVLDALKLNKEPEKRIPFGVFQ